MAVSKPTIPGILHATTILRAESYGASPSASASVNTTAIQAALDAGVGGVVTLLTPGTYAIAHSAATTTATGKRCALAIHAGTRLTLGPGVTIRVANASNCYALVDYEGQEADSPDIIVEGGIWDFNGANQTQQAGSSDTLGVDGTTRVHPTDRWMSHGLWFSRVDRIVVRDARMDNALKFAVLISDSENPLVENIVFNTLSDGVHMHGPIERGVIRNLRGYTNDNMVGLTIGDYTNYQTSIGSFTDCTVDGLIADGGKEPCRLVGTSSGGYAFEDIAIRNLSGTVSAGHGVTLFDDTGLVGCAMRRILIDGVNLDVPASNSCVLINGTGVESVIVRNVQIAGNNYGVRIETSSPRSIVVDGVQCDGSMTSDLALVYVAASKTLAAVQASNLFAKFASTSGSCVSVAGAITKLTGDNWQQENGRAAAVLSGTGTAAISNLSIKGVGRVIQSFGTQTILASNWIAENCAIIGEGNGTSIRIVGHNLSRSGTGSSVMYVVYGTCALDWPDCRMSLGSSGVSLLTPATGDRVYNTNAAIGDGVGLLTYDGSAWRRVPSSTMPQRATMFHEHCTVVSGGAKRIAADGTMRFQTTCDQGTSGANGDTFTHSFTLAAGTYTLEVLGMELSSSGLIDWYIDDVKNVSLQDWYNASSPTYNVLKTATVTVLTNGRHVLKGVINGKNASSSNYRMTLTCIRLYPTADS